ncbi:ABC transporter permease [Rhodoflexus caldus]|uniref:ABC transporter permease n=1 Tax=Rhodoflexus caldus TaxID=2891236 RepID=UPI002029D6D3|nr:iron ABC transporter permease [Rhodoflexus caldus]
MTFLFSRILSRMGKGLLLAIIAALLAVPPLYVVWQWFSPADSYWAHLYEYLLPDYLKNTLGLTTGVLLGTLLLGIPSAWLVAACEFPGRRLLSWLLVLPLAIPAYINAYVYKYTFERGLLQSLPFRPDVMHLGGAIAVMSLVLYPYIYLVTRTNFQRQSAGALEAAKLLGASPLRRFFAVALPMARPAIIGSAMLVLMECLNEYGTVKYYGVPTFTSGIFRAWFAMGSVHTAMKLAGLLLAVVFVLNLSERRLTRNLRYTAGKSERLLTRQTLHGWQATAAMLFCLIPSLGGFVFPFAQLLSWAYSGWVQGLLTVDFSKYLLQTLQVAFTSAAFIVLIALILAYIRRIGRGKLTQLTVHLANLGYAMPGAVVAIGVLALLLAVGKSLQVAFVGTLIALTYAYLVRFMAVAFNPLEAGLQKISPSMDNAAAILGKNRLQTLLLVHVPLLRGAILAALMLVVVDILKELPLTLILRPFNFDTLATKAYEYADDEKLQQSAAMSCLIVLAGMLPVFLLDKLNKSD